MKQFRDEIMPGMGAEFVKQFGALPQTFNRVNMNLTDFVDQETMEDTLGMLIREIDLNLEAQANTAKAAGK
jgi:hypothetical protein